MRRASLRPSGPRVAGREEEYAEVLELIRSGAELHYASGEALGNDALLRGDERYAEGLVRLARLEDLDAVAELADAISLVAQAHLAGDRELADALWEAACVAIGSGGGEQYECIKARARAGEPDAGGSLLRWASDEAVKRPLAVPLRDSPPPPDSLKARAK